jgi:hypothetical protein
MVKSGTSRERAPPDPTRATATSVHGRYRREEGAQRRGRFPVRTARRRKAGNMMRLMGKCPSSHCSVSTSKRALCVARRAGAAASYLVAVSHVDSAEMHGLCFPSGAGTIKATNSSLYVQQDSVILVMGNYGQWIVTVVSLLLGNHDSCAQRHAPGKNNGHGYSQQGRPG